MITCPHRLEVRENFIVGQMGRLRLNDLDRVKLDIVNSQMDSNTFIVVTVELQYQTSTALSLTHSTFTVHALFYQLIFTKQ